MVTWSLTKELKPSNGKKIAFSTNGVGSTGGQHVEECKLIHLYHSVQSLSPVDQGPPHQTRYTQTNKRKNEEESQSDGHWGNFPMDYALRSRIAKWNFIKLQSFCKPRTLSSRQSCNQKIGKRSLPMLHLIEGKYPKYTKNSRS